MLRCSCKCQWSCTWPRSWNEMFALVGMVVCNVVFVLFMCGHLDHSWTSGGSIFLPSLLQMPFPALAIFWTALLPSPQSFFSGKQFCNILLVWVSFASAFVLLHGDRWATNLCSHVVWRSFLLLCLKLYCYLTNFVLWYR